METQPQPRKTDPDDMSRPGPITFLIVLALAVIYVGVAYGDQSWLISDYADAPTPTLPPPALPAGEASIGKGVPRSRPSVVFLACGSLIA